MIEIESFKQLSIEDKDFINNYVQNSHIESYEYLFSSMYLWRKLNDVKYAVIDGALIIQKVEEGKGIFFAQPIGYKKENLKSLIEKLMEISKQFSETKYLFGDVDENFIEEIKEIAEFDINITEDVDDSEYVYNTLDLIELKGRKYHGHRNHCNSFENTYDYKIKNINDEQTIDDCLGLLNRWHEEVAVTVDQEMLMEIDAIRDIFCELKYLNMNSFAVYVEDNLAGFAVGEKVKNGTEAVIHIERGNIAYKGIYSFLNKYFLKHDFLDTQFVNRQEDCGNPGLRKAKESYHPVKMFKKYLLKISIK